MKRSGTLVSEQDIISKKSIEKLRTDRDALIDALRKVLGGYPDCDRIALTAIEQAEKEG
jgi:ribosomal 50S subunit-associated protein YjgA (DUF615 family)